MIRHRAGHWSFPKGHPDEGEAPQQCAERELREETALTISRWLELSPFTETYYFRRQGTVITKTVTYFAAEVEGKLRICQDELADARWVPLDKAESLASFPEAKAICRRLINEFPLS